MKLKQTGGWIFYFVLVAASIIVFYNSTEEKVFYPKSVRIVSKHPLAGEAKGKDPFTEKLTNGTWFTRGSYGVTDGYPVWYQVEIEDKSVGWIKADLQNRATEIVDRRFAKGRILNADGLVFRTKPFDLGEPIQTLPAGTEFTIRDMEFSHLKLMAMGGSEEWVYTGRPSEWAYTGGPQNSSMIIEKRKHGLLQRLFE